MNIVTWAKKQKHFKITWMSAHLLYLQHISMAQLWGCTDQAGAMPQLESQQIEESPASQVSM